MGFIAKVMGLSEKKENKNVDATMEILSEIKALKAQLRNLEDKFNMVSDDNQLEGLIYQSNALEARLRFLIRYAKSEKIVCSPKDLEMDTTQFYNANTSI